MLHDPTSFEPPVLPLANPPADLEPFLTLPRLRALPHPDQALPDPAGERLRPLSSPTGPGSGDLAGSPLPSPPVSGREMLDVRSPLYEIAAPLGPLAEIAELRLEQVLKWGHTIEKDLLLPLAHLPREAKETIAAAIDDIQFHRGGPAFAEARPRIRKRLLKAGAFLAAALDRLDAEPDDSADWPEL